MVAAPGTGQVTQGPRRSGRTRHEPERYYGFLVTQSQELLLIEDGEPTSYQDAISSPDSRKWQEAMRSEMDSMYVNKVWTLVDPPEVVRPIGCKWVFKKKTDIDGKVVAYKGRLVAKGYNQVEGVNCEETFAPVAMVKSIWILLAIAIYQDYEIWKMDVKTAFLNGNVEEDVYMS